MCRAISFFSMSNDAQFESGAIQDTRILTGSAFDAPCARTEIAATSPINEDRTSHICASHAGPARKLTIATFADKPQPRPFRSPTSPSAQVEPFNPFAEAVMILMRLSAVLPFAPLVRRPTSAG